MNWQTPITNTPAADCPHCGLVMPAHFDVCRACLRDLKATRAGWLLWRDLKSAQAVETLHRKRDTLSPWLSLEEAASRVASALAAVLQFLRLHSSAL